MNEPLVVEFLRKGGTLQELTDRYHLKAVRGRIHQNLVLLKYDQIESPLGEKIVGECRGLVLDSTDNWRVVSRSFDKFFNFGEGPAAPIDWNTATILEKLDGSLCVLYYYDGGWQVQTSGSPDAAGDVNGSSMTFAELFWSVWREHGYAMPFADHKDLCFSFELMTKYNRIVVQHTEPRLVLIGCRNRVTGEELSVSDIELSFYTMRNGKLAHTRDERFGESQWLTVRGFSFETYEASPVQAFQRINASFAAMDPMQQEGYVVVDSAFRRVKIKHPGYVAIHHLKEGASTRRLAEIVQSGEASEFLTYFPEWTEEFNNIQAGLNALRDELELEYGHIKDIVGQKDFALRAVKTRCPAALFAVRAGKAPSIEAYLRSMAADRLLDLIGLCPH